MKIDGIGLINEMESLKKMTQEHTREILKGSDDRMYTMVHIEENGYDSLSVLRSMTKEQLIEIILNHESTFQCFDEVYENHMDGDMDEFLEKHYHTHRVDIPK